MAAVRHRIEVLFPRRTKNGESWQNRAGNVALLHRRGTSSWVARVDGRWVALTLGGDSAGSAQNVPEAANRLASMLVDALGLQVLFDTPWTAMSVGVPPQ